MGAGGQPSGAPNHPNSSNLKFRHDLSGCKDVFQSSVPFYRDSFPRPALHELPPEGATRPLNGASEWGRGEFNGTPGSRGAAVSQRFPLKPHAPRPPFCCATTARQKGAGVGGELSFGKGKPVPSSGRVKLLATCEQPQNRMGLPAVFSCT